MIKRNGKGCSGKGMTNEEQTICRLKNDGINECRGGLFTISVSRLEKSFGHRIYQCDKCETRYKFSN